MSLSLSWSQLKLLSVSNCTSREGQPLCSFDACSWTSTLSSNLLISFRAFSNCFFRLSLLFFSDFIWSDWPPFAILAKFSQSYKSCVRTVRTHAHTKVKGSRIPAAHPHPEIPKVPLGGLDFDRKEIYFPFVLLEKLLLPFWRLFERQEIYFLRLWYRSTKGRVLGLNVYSQISNLFF